ncbi:MAG: sigma-70 family RNA polymerase sigma factor [Proteobacteria bacterium]|nr:sigma-70 family RNA polymerase sigma factor [Pseudomonadota bacterium]MBU6426109.1 sigma-70 family RNA polymerase sigma factor [Rhodospirillales bacterium]
MADAAAPGQAELTALYGDWIKRMALLMKARMPWADLEEMLQWGAIGMMEASQRFDPGHGVAFQAFASRRIKGAMIDGLRREGTRRRGQTSFDQEKVEIAAHDDGSGPEDPLCLLTRIDNRALLVEALRGLPQLEYRVLALHFYDELNNREIASVLDISEGYASRLRKRALEALALHINAAQRGEFVS